MASKVIQIIVFELKPSIKRKITSIHIETCLIIRNTLNKRAWCRAAKQLVDHVGFVRPSRSRRAALWDYSSSDASADIPTAMMSNTALSVRVGVRDGPIGNAEILSCREDPESGPPYGGRSRGLT